MSYSALCAVSGVVRYRLVRPHMELQARELQQRSGLRRSAKGARRHGRHLHRDERDGAHAPPVIAKRATELEQVLPLSPREGTLRRRVDCRVGSSRCHRVSGSCSWAVKRELVEITAAESPLRDRNHGG